ncbi:UDP-N-acetylmuramoyl-L-alanine--D-glutamate ligase [Herbaspirillum sp. RTI4]|uniref:UDP-N-acetylmuramoyl-L-alanine--D-glutamate ligase n=1 Tax=Herbaspirillum sp. RTI4 TaxID=3048640 RepID=UPI002AB54407|nr:UDP-N-acetylmuramoyl-L-alanine--D-glutamate ligase [Herbaspirillum sp. RTI4]MDY7577476.1 UDP-N-acetylmuramoyl-L-alanine--D-glutamate ligase [Herbaspirillum sp. RTI4]MEA9981752.1 UDP-N-acetylmuramoyl-L-alanine--D-glutamate ligase [Herbaspirillum sp. RTI4]
MNYSGKHVLVLGLGESGLAMARWLLHCGASVRVADTRDQDAVAARLQVLREIAPDTEFIGGRALDAALLNGVDFLALSPGLSPQHELAEIVAAANEKEIPLWGEIELFAQALASLQEQEGYAPKVLAITGTNGKTTVTRLTGLLCERAGLSVKVAGNISPAALDVLREALIQTAPPEAEQDAPLAVSAESAESVEPMEPMEPTEPTEPAEPVDPEEPAALAETAEPENVTESVESTNTTEPASKTAQQKWPSLPDVWVLELSSFQLYATQSLQADAAVLLNITQDHLDWHGDMAAYVADKARIFGARTIRVLNRDDARTMQLASPANGTVSFGMDAPNRADNFGLVDDNGMLWLAQAVAQDETDGTPDRRRKKKNQQELIEQAFIVQRLMPVDALHIRGMHNAQNALAALALCRAIDLPLAPLLHGLRDYRGEPHRVELVAVLQDVEYYDDSKGTNVGATVAALNGLGHGGRPNRLLLIAGGEGKGQDFTPLAQPVSKYGRAVFLIGRDAPQIRAALADSGVALIDCATLEQAVQQAALLAQPGDAVLLSPACASFDMFKNYAHRAEVFVEAVRELALEHGEVLA